MDLFRKMLEYDSTSGKEREFALMLASELECGELRSFEVGDGSLNLLLCWGEPRVVFCTHMDTVPPYLPPRFAEDRVLGRGSCDAKGQIYSMYKACRRLEAMGKDGFGLLLLSGEETGSYGAKAFAKTSFRAPYLVVGEPTDNCMVSASKGTKSFDLRFIGEAFHSGYPARGRSAVDMFVNFMNSLASAGFPEDEVLGATTWNVGQLHSDNPQNILSPLLSCRLYFRTGFASDAAVCAFMENARSQTLEVSARGGDAPLYYHTVPGIPTKTVSFGSDAPHLTNFTHRMICGPGSIEVAHRDDEHILLRDIDTAVDQYVKIYESCN